MYDPTTARWLSRDPITFEGGDAHLYRYVGNRPTDATDPTGLQFPPLWAGAYARAQVEIKREGELAGIMRDMVSGVDRLYQEHKGNVPPITTPSGAVCAFPNRMWPQYRDAIQYSLDNYVGRFPRRLQIQPLTSRNFHGLFIPSPWLLINQDEFYGSEDIAIATLIHEPQHDPSKLGAGHDKFKDLVPLEEHHTNAHEQCINYLNAARGPGGKSYWQYLLDRNKTK